MAKKSSNLATKALAVLAKDLMSEFRTRYAVNAILLFAVTTLAAVSFSIGGVGVEPRIQAALFWVIIYFSAMSGLSRAFVREEEAKTSVALKLSAPANAIYLGKFGFNLLMLAGLVLVVVPLFTVLMNMQVHAWWHFWAIIIIGSLGMSAAATLVAAIVSKANAKASLFTVLSFPILLPLLVVVIQGTGNALTGSSFGSIAGDIRMLVAYTAIMLTTALMLFKFVWEE